MCVCVSKGSADDAILAWVAVFCAILRTRSSFHFRKFSIDGAPISRMMVALSADRHMVLRHLKIALICKWRLTVQLDSLMGDLRVVGFTPTGIRGTQNDGGTSAHQSSAATRRKRIFCAINSFIA